MSSNERSGNERSGNERSGILAVPELAAAGIVLLLGAVGSVALAVSPPADTPISTATWSAVMVLQAILLAAAGVESLRRRHLPFVLAVPMMPALVTLIYIVHSGRMDLGSQVVISVAIMALVWSKRAAFF